MEKHDHYTVLGVGMTESAHGIRDAFHELMLRRELTAPDSANRFQEIVQAHRVLSDARARASYDRGLEAEPEHLGASAPVRPVRGGADVPLAEPISLLRDFHATSPSPSIEEIFERLLRNFSGVHVPKSERLRPLDLDLIVSQDEVAGGGFIVIAVPVFQACEVCQGSARDWIYPCLSCAGTGMVEHEHQVRIAIPALVHSDAIFEIPIRGLGIHNLYLRVRIRITD
jgi:molecular chaperone DnaJ/curved DNA-binding protein